jgi:hypothetical protein
MDDTKITLEEYKLFIRAIYQLETITKAKTNYTLNKAIQRASETLQELKQIKNNFYNL